MLDTCGFCGAPATLLCDFPQGDISSMLIHYQDGRVEAVDETVLRCSRPICEKCATGLGGMDICPKCLERLIDEHERFIILPLIAADMDRQTADAFKAKLIAELKKRGRDDLLARLKDEAERRGIE